MEQECLSCKSLKREISLSPGEVIYTGIYWQVEHAYPTAIEGWLVCVLKRHAEALHELTKEEWEELAVLQRICVSAIQKEFACEKEYTACFAEGKGFNHIHVHIIARPKDLPGDVRGPKIFSLLGKAVDQSVPPEQVEKICTKLKESIIAEIDR